jgi:hypothetical protein
MIRRILAGLVAPPPVDRHPTGTLGWDSIYPDPHPGAIAPPATPARMVRAVAAATTPQTLALPNPRRASLTIANDSTAVLFVKYGPGAAAIAGGYSVKLGAGATWMIESPGAYQGEVSGVWAAANGSASITETGPDG